MGLGDDPAAEIRKSVERARWTNADELTAPEDQRADMAAGEHGEVGRVRIRFFFRRNMGAAVTEKVKTTSGYIPVSTPEMTAYDLVRYRKGTGSIDHVATIISELAERMDGKRLLSIATQGEETPVVQRLGYLLERTGHPDLAAPLLSRVEQEKPKTVALEPRSKEAAADRDHRWRILVNTTIEVEA